MKLNIVVTGGAGYIGSILIPELLQLGHRVTLVDSFMYRQNSLAHVCTFPTFDVINGDARDDQLMDRVTKGADVVIPLAALVGAPLCSKDPVAATTVNRDAPIRLFKKLSKSQWVLMPTTNSAYGSGDKDNFCTEESPLNPLSLYAKDKVEVEKALMERENSVSFRLATVFGMSPRMRIDLLVNDFVYRAVHDRFVVLFESHFKRNYVHVRDVSGVFIHALNHFGDMAGEIFNVGLSDANISKWELCTAIKRHIPNFVFMEAPVGQDPDKRNYVVSNEKIEKQGWKPAHSLDSGIQELIKGFTMIKNSTYSNV